MLRPQDLPSSLRLGHNADPNGTSADSSFNGSSSRRGGDTSARSDEILGLARSPPFTSTASQREARVPNGASVSLLPQPRAVMGLLAPLGGPSSPSKPAPLAPLGGSGSGLSQLRGAPVAGGAGAGVCRKDADDIRAELRRAGAMTSTVPGSPVIVCLEGSGTVCQ
jgi:hypothetical protein